jgi:putative glycosyltransferase (TIGR04348 family)
MKPTCLLITPALAAANNGNWQTARRWKQYAGHRVNMQLAIQHDGQQSFSCAIALHAFRSAQSVLSLKRLQIPCALVLTGTDLYRDIRSEAIAQDALAAADLLVVLNERGFDELPPEHKHKARCIFQSAPMRKKLAPRQRTDDFAFVGHLRLEKDPLTVAKAFTYLSSPRLRLRVAGQAHISRDGAAQAIAESATKDSRIELLGGIAHHQARALIAQSQALILSSIMEGGANVLIEALTCGTPVLASKISGNIGMLGEDYPGYFPLGDARALAALIDRFLHDGDFREHLNAVCQRRRPLFSVDAESFAVNHLLQDLLTLAPQA